MDLALMLRYSPPSFQGLTPDDRTVLRTKASDPSLVLRRTKLPSTMMVLFVFLDLWFVLCWRSA